jgi:hypothetical protein
VNGLPVARIYLNGRWARDRSVLEAIRAEDVATVEVVPFAGAAYSDNPLAPAIIRITLKKTPAGAIRGSITASGSMNSADTRAGKASGMTNYTGKNFNLYDILRVNSGVTAGRSDRITGYPLDSLVQRTGSTSGSESVLYGNSASLVYDINKHHVIGTSLSFSLSNGDSDGKTRTFNHHANGTTRERSAYEGCDSSAWESYHAALDYTWTFPTTGSSFHFKADYGYYDRKTGGSYELHDLAPATTARYRDHGREKRANLELEARVDLKHGKGKSTTIGIIAYPHAGGLVYRKDAERDSSGVWLPDDPSSDYFQRDENTLGAYAVHAGTSGKWSYNTGLRVYKIWEELTFKAGTTVKRDDLLAVPNVTLAWTINKEKGDVVRVNASGGQSRASSRYYNPNVVIHSDTYYSTGNPNLSRELITILQASWSLRERWSGDYYYITRSNMVRLVHHTDTNNPAARYTIPENNGNETKHRFRAGFTGKITGWWRTNLDVHAHLTRGKSSGERYDNLLAGVSCANTLTPGKGWGGRAYFEIFTKDRNGDYITTGGYDLDVSLYRKLFKNRVTLTLSVEELLYKLPRERAVSRENFTSLYKDRSPATRVEFQFQYTFSRGKNHKNRQIETM